MVGRGTQPRGYDCSVFFCHISVQVLYQVYQHVSISTLCLLHFHLSHILGTETWCQRRLPERSSVPSAPWAACWWSPCPSPSSSPTLVASTTRTRERTNAALKRYKKTAFLLHPVSPRVMCGLNKCARVWAFMHINYLTIRRVLSWFPKGHNRTGLLR